MTEQDFGKLTLDTVIYYKGEKEKINKLENDGDVWIRFSSNNEVYLWSDVCHECSLTPPKQTKRYWIWAIKSSYWFMTYNFYDDEMKDTNGVAFGYKNYECRKLENLYIDVEV